MKACPFCAEKIKDAAIVCRYCGRDLPTTAPAKPGLNGEASRSPIFPILVGCLFGILVTILVHAAEILELSELSDRILDGTSMPLVLQATMRNLFFQMFVTLIAVSGVSASLLYAVRLNSARESLKSAFTMFCVFLLLETIPVGALLIGWLDPPPLSPARTHVFPTAEPLVTDPAPTATVPNIIAPTVVGAAYIETFDQQTSRFPSGTNSAGWQFEFAQGGHYRIAATGGANTYSYQLAGWSIADGSILLDTWSRRENPIGAGHAIPFRWVDEDNYYILFLQSWGEGELRILVQKRLNGRWSDLGWCHPPAQYFNLACQAFLKDRGASRERAARVQIELEQDLIAVSIDGEWLLEMTDANFHTGDVGIGARTGPEGGVEVYFDDLLFDNIN